MQQRWGYWRMRLQFIKFLIIFPLFLGACAQTQFAAHAIKNIPFSEKETPRSKGTFKVGNPYKIDGRAYFPKESYTLEERALPVGMALIFTEK